MPVYEVYMSFVRLFVVTVVLGLPFASFATIEDEFQQLKTSGRNYEVVGTVCEEVARLQTARQYPAEKYTVVTGIAYGDNTRTIGELDVIVFENATGDAVKVSEVKCWKDLGAGLKKARDQRQRFLKSVRGGGRLVFQSTGDHRAYSHDQFRKLTNFTSMAQKGATGHGYEEELEYSLEDLMGLRARMIQCQNTGECTRH
jgi:hypothetical protein